LQAERAKLETERQRQEIERGKLEVASVPTPSLPRQTGREITGKDGAPMVLIPAGSFWMGSTPEEVARVIEECVQDGLKEDQCKDWFKSETPRHRVALDAFYLDKYEVTNELFERFVRATGHQTTAEREGKAFAFVEGKGWQEVSGANWRQPEADTVVFASNRTNHPVVSVSWEDAEAYCRWARKRLPTEAEFEYATRAGTQTRYWWGDGSPGPRRVANIADESARGKFKGIMAGYGDGYVRTAPVGSYEANPFGLFDMTGNVAEWTADWYGGGYYEVGPVHNPKGPSSGQFKVLRGGSWASHPQLVRSAVRNFVQPALRYDNLGVRCAKTP